MQSTEVTKTKEQILKEGAAKFINVMETPSEALEAFTYGLTDVNLFGRQEPYSVDDYGHFTMILIIRSIILPWFAAGENMSDEMGCGIEEIYDQSGYDGYLEDFVKYLLIGTEEWPSGPCEVDTKCIDGLISISETLKEYKNFLS